MFLSEVWAESHWADAHIQLPEWSDYRADFGLLNGRVYPDTVAPNGPTRPDRPRPGPAVPPGAARRRHRRPGDPAGRPDLQYQPLVLAGARATPGERVALRFANLGFKEAAMTLDGITMHVVGRDAT